MVPDNPERAERRDQVRRPANGEVVLRMKSGTPVSGQLVDIGQSGFRARHRSGGLRPGREVEFVIAEFPGRARVVWTRRQEDDLESGFQILD